MNAIRTSSHVDFHDCRALVCYGLMKRVPNVQGWRTLNALFIVLVCARVAHADLPFPFWLTQLSGRTQWPGEVAPYVPLNGVSLDNVSRTLCREQNECHRVVQEDCSFDCGHCKLPSDIETCVPMSQTFDDGPTEATPELLDFLKKTKTKTSFFLIGMNVVEMPAAVRREHHEGHLLGVHTWSHRFLPALSNEDVLAELQWCVWAINASAGVVPRYFRPPYGGLDNRIRDIAAKLNLVPVVWDRDTDDWQLSLGTRTSAEVLEDLSRWTVEGQPQQRWSLFKKTKTRGLLLEHDLSRENVKLAMSIKKRIKGKQKTVAQCANARPYV